MQFFGVNASTFAIQVGLIFKEEERKKYKYAFLSTAQSTNWLEVCWIKTQKSQLWIDLW